MREPRGATQFYSSRTQRARPLGRRAACEDLQRITETSRGLMEWRLSPQVTGTKLKRRKTSPWETARSFIGMTAAGDRC